MKRARKIVVRTLLGLTAGILLLGVAAPFLSANLFRERIRTALESALHRKVEMGSVHFNLFNGPGFSVEDVLISEDASAGIEPFAHVQSIKARVRISSLFSGKLAFSKLKLVEPSVNLVKTDAGPWNIQAFFPRATSSVSGSASGPGAAGMVADLASVPDIEISDGRINFKFGMVKSVFYISNADVSIYPKSDDSVIVDFSGEPARTDTGAQGFGRFSAKGLVHRPESGPDQVDMALHLERSALSELVRLFSVRDLGVHGFVSSNATFSGTTDHIAINGDLKVSGLHRWDLMPADNEGFTLKYSGALEMRSQKLELATITAPEEKIPVALRFRAADFISAPRVAATMILRDLPAASLVGTARHFGAALPADIVVDGKVNGAIGFSYPEGLQGELGISRASFTLPSEGSARIESATIVIADRKLAMEPSEVTLADGGSARIEAHYDADAQRFTAQIDGKRLKVADLKSGPGRLIAGDSIPIMDNLLEGTLEGGFRYEQHEGAAGQWSGTFDVQNALLDLPGISAPLHVNVASMVLDAGKIEVSNLRGRVGSIPILADYRFDAAGGPHFMRLTLPEVELAAIERLLLPTLYRNQGILANLRLRRAQIPDWLKDRDIEGSIQIKRLRRDGAPVCAFKARLAWTGTTAELNNASCVEDDMSAQGRIVVNLGGRVPQYHLAGQVQNLDYHEGRLDLTGQFDSSGLGRELLINASSKGSFTGRDLRLSPDMSMRDITGVFDLGGLGMSLTKIQANDGVDTFTGQGSSLADGHFVLELITSARRQVKLSGSLLPLRGAATP